MMPPGFPPATTVQHYFYRWRDNGTWQKINHHLTQDARIAQALGCIDIQLMLARKCRFSVLPMLTYRK